MLILYDQHDTAFLLTWFVVSVTGRKLNIGFTTRAKLSRLLDDGDITPQQMEKFHEAALAFLIHAVDYSLKKLPLQEPLLKHAKFVDVWQRLECGVEDALYFVERLGFFSAISARYLRLNTLNSILRHFNTGEIWHSDTFTLEFWL